jgi:hypothetical protein
MSVRTRRYGEGSLRPLYLAPMLFAVLVVACGTTAPTSSVGTPPPTSVARSTATPTLPPSFSPTPIPTHVPLPRGHWPSGQTVVADTLVGPGSGWVLTNRALWLTLDDGVTWANATPVGLAIEYPIDPDTQLPRSSVRGIGAVDSGHAYLATIQDTSTTISVTVWRTGDGGETWSLTRLDPVAHATEATFCGSCLNFQPSVEFDVIDVNNAFMSFGLSAPVDSVTTLVYRTSDGGATWVPLDTSSIGPLANDGSTGAAVVHFQSPSVGVVSHLNSISSTTTGWGSWAVVEVPAGCDAPAVTFLDDVNWYAGCGLDYGTRTYDYLASTDHGATWVARHASLPAVPNENAAYMTFFTPLAWVVTIGTANKPGYDTIGPSYTYRTTDGGAHWTALGRQPFGGSRATFRDDGHAWAGPTANASYGKLYASTDDGRTWLTITP